MNMKWINKIEAGPEDSLRILTNPMACTYVPNIARYIPLRYFEKEDILYRIMKYQMLGKYFIVLPDYYIISNNFNIRGERNDRYPKTRVRNVMIKILIFTEWLVTSETVRLAWENLEQQYLEQVRMD